MWRSSSASAAAGSELPKAGGRRRQRHREEEPRHHREAAREDAGDPALPRVARGQLDLIENSFQLIADQIVTMQSPQELSGQLNDLLDGVEAIAQTARDTEQMLNSMERWTA